MSIELNWDELDWIIGTLEDSLIAYEDDEKQELMEKLREYQKQIPQTNRANEE